MGSTKLQQSRRLQLIGKDFERQETDEIVGSDQEAVNDDDPVPELGRLNADGRYPRRVDAASRGEVPILAQEASFNLEEYVSYEGAAGPDPRTVSVGVVADSLVRIIEIEGPMLAKRAYDIYLRGCG